jgi:predicted PurR-regulated permease PerM
MLLLVSLFLSLAVEPGVNRLAKRGWRRGTATAVILVGVLVAFLVFVVAIGALVGQQIADLLGNSEKYVTRTVNFLNDNFGAHIDAEQVIKEINDETGGATFIQSQQTKVVDLSVTALGLLVQGLSVMLFTFYLVADGPKLRRVICSRLPRAPAHRARHLGAGHREDRWLPVLAGAAGRSLGAVPLGRPAGLRHRAPVAMALWVGVISQFLPVVGTYLAGALPVLVTFIDSPHQGAGGADLRGRLPAAGELPVPAAHHRPHDGPAPRNRVRRRHRRWRRAGCRSAPSLPFPAPP